MQAADRELVAALVHARAGIVLGNDKAYLIESRLASVARRLGFDSPADIVAALRGSPNEPILRAVTDALTTNETSFFRDGRPFDQLSDLVLPELHRARAAERTLRIWSAAASTGQEAYSIAMCLDELAPRFAGWHVSILGTDIAELAIVRAREGRYSAFEVQRGLSEARLARHFSRSGDSWTVSERLARMIDFRCFNLLADSRQFGRFDVVFLRNVLIYFDLETRRRVLGDVRAMLADDGYLFLGGTETVLGVSDAFVPWPAARGIVRPAPTDQTSVGQTSVGRTPTSMTSAGMTSAEKIPIGSTAIGGSRISGALINRNGATATSTLPPSRDAERQCAHDRAPRGLDPSGRQTRLTGAAGRSD